MADDEEDGYESYDDHFSEGDDDLVDLLSLEESIDSIEAAVTVRVEFVDKVFKTLSADAQRCDGELSRGDVNRIYLRRNLSIAECMAVEDRLIATGYRIRDEEDASDADAEKDSGSGSSHHYLSEAEEKQLGRQIQLALRLPEDTSKIDPLYVQRILADADKARAAFVATNVRFVELLARRMGEHRHLSLEDVKQEGFIGLLRAADLYDPERGFRFKTYATWWIEQKMRRAIADGDRTIRLPVHIQDKLARARRAKSKLKETLGRSPTLDELANAIGIDSEKLMKLYWYVRATECAEGDSPVGNDATLLSLVEDSSESTFDKIVYQELQRRFSDVLETLPPREARILRMRFGIDEEHEYTLESLGQQYSLTRERIRQIEAKALAKLRLPSRSDRLKGFLGS